MKNRMIINTDSFSGRASRMFVDVVRRMIRDVSLMRFLFLIFASCVFLTSCVSTNEEKKEFISKKRDETNNKVTKKYGKLIVPEFLKDDDLAKEV